MLNDNEFKVYKWLWAHRDDGNWPSGIELGRRLGIGRMTVSRALSTLEELGAIECERRGRTRQQVIMDSIEVVMSPREVLMVSNPLAELAVSNE